jgi:hypothetical protein
MPVCTEKKSTLSGRVYWFKCELVHLTPGFGVLRYVLDLNYDVSSVRLRPGDITHAFYWTDRPYTLYKWHLERNAGAEKIYYFNIADRISLQPDEFAWRDLMVDILVGADGQVRVLDEDELPKGLDRALVSYIQEAKSVILGGYRDIINSADTVLQELLEGKEGRPAL